MLAEQLLCPRAYKQMLWGKNETSQKTNRSMKTKGCISERTLLAHSWLQKFSVPAPGCSAWAPRMIPALSQTVAQQQPAYLPLHACLPFLFLFPLFFFFPVYTEQTAWETQFLHCKPSHTWAEGSEIFRFIKKELGDREGGMTLEVKCFHQSIGTWVWPPDPTSKSWADTVPERGRQEDPWRLLESQSEQTDELQFQCLGPVSR